MQQITALSDYNHEIYATTSLDEAIEAVDAVAVGMGFTGVACIYSCRTRLRDNDANPPSVRIPSKRLCSDNSWFSQYDCEFFKFDAVYNECLTTTLPVAWSYDNSPQLVVDAKHKATAGQVSAFGQMVKETGLRGGISVPIHGLSGGVGYIVFSSTDKVDRLLQQYHQHADQLLGITHRFYDAMAGRLESSLGGKIKLTKRELECLSLMAIGKTTEVAARILELSYSTVRFHLHNAEQKLGTYSRAHAIAKASYMGLLGPLD